MHFDRDEIGTQIQGGVGNRFKEGGFIRSSRCHIGQRARSDHACRHAVAAHFHTIDVD
jgi:hypothetical protein